MGAEEDIVFVVEPGEAGQRLDRLCVSRYKSLSRNQVQILNEKGGITVDGGARPDSFKVTAGQRIEVRPSAVHREGWDPNRIPEPQGIPVSLVYEDEDIVVVNKPPGLVVHPAHGNPDRTLVNALLGRGVRLARLGGTQRPGIVHRLDKDTSGLMVVAKSDEAYAGMTARLKDKEVHKEYHAIVLGNMGRREMTVDAPIGRHPVHRQQMAVVRRGGKQAVTKLFVIDSYSHFDYIRLTTYTGRTHQIRVHLSHLRHPLLGDSVYGGRPRTARALGMRTKAAFEKLLEIMNRHALHASLLSFAHPVSGRLMTFRTALPPDMMLALETLYSKDRITEVQD